MSNELQVRSQGALVSLGDLEKMAGYIAKSGLFGVKKVEDAIALMLIAQAEGQHPATIGQDYDIISGRAARKTHSVLSRFQQAGGKIQWETLTDKCAKATFTPPAGTGGPVTIEWTIEQAAKISAVEWENNEKKTIKLTEKHNWRSYPRAMLRARCIAEGIRAVFPGAIGGMMVVEEAQDTPPDDTSAEVLIEQPRARSEPAKPTPQPKSADVADAEVISETKQPSAEQSKPEKKTHKPIDLQDCVKLLDDAGEHPDHAMPTILEWRKVLPEDDRKKLDELLEALGVAPPAKQKAAVKPLTTSQQRILKARCVTNNKTVADLEAFIGCKLEEIPFDSFAKAQTWAMGS